MVVAGRLADGLPILAWRYFLPRPRTSLARYIPGLKHDQVSGLDVIKRPGKRTGRYGQGIPLLQVGENGCNIKKNSGRPLTLSGDVTLALLPHTRPSATLPHRLARL